MTTLLVIEDEATLLKSKLVAMFSHDFRNPLASMLSSNSLLRDYADRMDNEPASPSDANRPVNGSQRL